ncbi:hypothetical protein, partial [Spirosoma humi]
AAGATANTGYKLAGAYKLNDLVVASNTSLSPPVSSVNIPTGLLKLDVGSNNGSFVMNGWVRQVKYYPRRVSNSFLQSLTA